MSINFSDIGGIELKKSRYFLCFISLLLIFLFVFSGCDVKLIEKVDSSDATETTALALPESSGDDFSGVESTTSGEEMPETIPGGKESSQTPPEETIDGGSNTRVVGDITFTIENKKIYTKRECKLFLSVNGGDYLTVLPAGIELISVGVSTNNSFHIVHYKDEIDYFVVSAALSYDKVAEATEPKEQEVTSAAPKNQTPQTTTPAQKPKETTPPKTTTPVQKPKETTPPKTTTPAPKATDPPQKETIVIRHTVPAETKPQEPTGGIAYPSKPSSTSINYGVTFADVNINVKTVRTADLNSGPAKALNSNGYKKIQTFPAGTKLKATGIGKNGWIRIKLSNGTIGYIDGIALVKA